MLSIEDGLARAQVKIFVYAPKVFFQFLASIQSQNVCCSAALSNMFTLDMTQYHFLEYLMIFVE